MLSEHALSRLHIYQIDSSEDLLVAGWRESVALPEFGLETLGAKLDSGASLSSLHAIDIEIISRRRDRWVRFWTESDELSDVPNRLIRCEARLIAERSIRSSNGQTEVRPVVETILYMAGFQWPVELTLCDRSTLECKLLLGRSALASRCMIDCSRKFVLTRP
jgi:hypothetical protein